MNSTDSVTTHTLEFNCGTSRGADTYGYTTVSCRIDGKRRGFCSGGGYDMQGASFGKALEKLYTERLNALVTSGAAHREYYRAFGGGGERWERNEDHAKRVDADRTGLYGLTGYFTSRGGMVDHASIDGACGMGSVRDIARAIGVTLKFVSSSRNRTLYILTDSHPALFPAPK